MKYDSASNEYFRVVRTGLNGKNKKILTKFIKNGILHNEYEESNENLLIFIKKAAKK